MEQPPRTLLPDLCVVAFVEPLFAGRPVKIEMKKHNIIMCCFYPRRTLAKATNQCALLLVAQQDWCLGQQVYTIRESTNRVHIDTMLTEVAAVMVPVCVTLEIPCVLCVIRESISQPRRSHGTQFTASSQQYRRLFILLLQLYKAYIYASK